MNEAKVARLLGGVALLVALGTLAFSIVMAHRANARYEQLVNAHQRHVQFHNDRQRKSTGAVLDALGLSGGKVIGDTLDALTPVGEQRNLRGRRRR